MSEQPEIKIGSDVKSANQHQEKNENTNDAEDDPDDDPFAKLAEEDTEQRAFTFNTHFNDEVNIREADEANTSAKKTVCSETYFDYHRTREC